MELEGKVRRLEFTAGYLIPIQAARSAEAN
jgi:hypothetical protein